MEDEKYEKLAQEKVKEINVLLQKKHTSLETTISSKNQLIASLQQSIEDLAKKYHESDERSKMLQATLNSDNQEISSLKESLLAQQSECSEYKSALDTANQQYLNEKRKYQETSNSLSQIRSKVEEDMRSIREEYNSKSEDIEANYSNQIAKLNDEIKERDSIISTYQDQVKEDKSNGIAAQERALFEVKNSFDKTLRDKQSQYDTLASQLKDLQDKYEEDTKKLSYENEDLKLTIEGLKAKLDAIETTIRVKNTGIQQMETERVSASIKYNEMVKRYEEIIQSLNAKLESTQTQLHKAALDYSQRIKLSNDEKEEAYQTEKNQYIKKISELKTQLKKSENRILALENNKEPAENDILIRQQCNKLEREATTLQKTIEELEKDNKKLSDSVSKYKIEKQQTQMQLEELTVLHEQITKIKQESYGYQHEKETMRQKLIDCERKIKTYEEKINIMQNAAEEIDKPKPHIDQIDEEVRSSASSELLKREFYQHIENIDMSSNKNTLKKSKEIAAIQFQNIEDSKKQLEIELQKAKEQMLLYKESLLNKEKDLNDANAKVTMIQAAFDKAVIERDSMIKISTNLKQSLNALKNKMTEEEIKQQLPIMEERRKVRSTSPINQIPVSDINNDMRLEGRLIEQHDKDVKYMPNSKKLTANQKKALDRIKTSNARRPFRGNPRNYNMKE